MRTAVPKRKRRCLVAVVVALWSTHCSLAAPQPAPKLLPGHVKPVVKRLIPQGTLPLDAHLHLGIGLPLRNPADLEQLLQELYDPASHRYRNYLTPKQFAERFGPTPEDYQRLVQFVGNNGIRVTAQHSNRLMLDVEGDVSSIQRVLHTTLRTYRHPNEQRTFYSLDTEPSIDLAIPIQDIQGLDNYALPRPMSLRRSAVRISQASPVAGSAPDGSYRGNDFRAAYAPAVRLTGSGQSVGLLEFDGYYTNDIALYEKDTGIRNVPLQNVLLDGLNGAAGTDNSEVALDIEMAIAMAPGLAKVLVYEGALPNSILSRMASDNLARQLSSSWAYAITLTTESIFKQFAAQGQAMFQASGDGDAYYSQVPPPGDNPNLTIVGGTTLTTSGPGGTWLSEATWNWYNEGLGFGGSGGGVSSSYTLPSWQQGISMAANQGATSFRNLPDVALVANNIWVRADNGVSEALAGTSASAPLWAGFMALANQQAAALGGHPIGFANPALYAIAKGSKYSTAFRDIKLGNNTNHFSPTKYFAVSGYDLCTGWGTPTGQPLINALTGVTNVAPAFLTSRITGPSAQVGQAYAASVAAQASDPDPGDKLRFTKTSGPAWLSISNNGAVSGTPASSNLGTNMFALKVTDAGGLSATGTLVITVISAPRFISNPFTEPSANAGFLYSGSVANNVTNPNPAVILSFSKVGGPAWLVVATNGLVSGTPSDSDVGTNVFTLSVGDVTGLSSLATMFLLVNGPPFFFAGSLLEPIAEAGKPYSATIAPQARDPNPGDTLTFAKLNGPAWLQVTGNGFLAGTPYSSDRGTNLFMVEVRDSGGLTNNATMYVFVQPPAPLALQLATSQNQVALTWTGGIGPYQVQAATDIAKPTWMNIGQSFTNQDLALPLTNSTLFYRVKGR